MLDAVVNSSPSAAEDISDPENESVDPANGAEVVGESTPERKVEVASSFSWKPKSIAELDAATVDEE